MVVKKKDNFPTSEREERKRDWYIEETYVDSNNSKAISLSHLTTNIKVTLLLQFPSRVSRLVPFAVSDKALRRKQQCLLMLLTEPLKY